MALKVGPQGYVVLSQDTLDSGSDLGADVDYIRTLARIPDDSDLNVGLSGTSNPPKIGMRSSVSLALDQGDFTIYDSSTNIDPSSIEGNTLLYVFDPEKGPFIHAIVNDSDLAISRLDSDRYVGGVLQTSFGWPDDEEQKLTNGSIWAMIGKGHLDENISARPRKTYAYHYSNKIFIAITNNTTYDIDFKMRMGDDISNHFWTNEAPFPKKHFPPNPTYDTHQFERKRVWWNFDPPNSSSKAYAHNWYYFSLTNGRSRGERNPRGFHFFPNRGYSGPVAANINRHTTAIFEFNSNTKDVGGLDQHGVAHMRFW